MAVVRDSVSGLSARLALLAAGAPAELEGEVAQASELAGAAQAAQEELVLLGSRAGAAASAKEDWERAHRAPGKHTDGPSAEYGRLELAAGRAAEDLRRQSQLASGLAADAAKAVRRLELALGEFEVPAGLAEELPELDAAAGTARAQAAALFAHWADCEEHMRAQHPAPFVYDLVVRLDALRAGVQRLDDLWPAGGAEELMEIACRAAQIERQLELEPPDARRQRFSLSDERQAALKRVSLARDHVPRLARTADRLDEDYRNAARAAGCPVGGAETGS